jgi:hypothetical protein
MIGSALVTAKSQSLPVRNHLPIVSIADAVIQPAENPIYRYRLLPFSRKVVHFVIGDIRH